MCLAIYKPASAAPNWDYLANGIWNNDDGWGFAAVVNGQLVLDHGLGGFTEFREHFQPFGSCQAVIHFRMATHGTTTVGNCHPFTVTDDLAVIHNGILPIACNVDKARSDTWHAVELLFKPLHVKHPDFWRCPSVKFMAEQAWSGSKLVFLHASGKFSIWNEDDGWWDKDMTWYSNRTCEYRSGRSYSMGYSWPDGPTVSRGIHSTSTTVSSASAKEREAAPFRLGWTYEGEPAATDEPAGGSADGNIETVEFDLTTTEQDEFPGDDSDSSAATAIRCNQLLQHGFSGKTLEEIMELTGRIGIEAIHDLI